MTLDEFLEAVLEDNPSEARRLVEAARMGVFSPLAAIAPVALANECSLCGCPAERFCSHHVCYWCRKLGNCLLCEGDRKRKKPHPPIKVSRALLLLV